MSGLLTVNHPERDEINKRKEHAVQPDEREYHDTAGDINAGTGKGQQHNA